MKEPEKLPNIGKIVAEKLHNIEVSAEEELAVMGRKTPLLIFYSLEPQFKYQFVFIYL